MLLISTLPPRNTKQGISGEIRLWLCLNLSAMFSDQCCFILWIKKMTSSCATAAPKPCTTGSLSEYVPQNWGIEMLTWFGRSCGRRSNILPCFAAVAHPPHHHPLAMCFGIGPATCSGPPKTERPYCQVPGDQRALVGQKPSLAAWPGVSMKLVLGCFRNSVWLQAFGQVEVRGSKLKKLN